MSFPRYPAYKDSGVEWLGEVPEHWTVMRLRQAARINPSRSESAALPRSTEVSFLPMEAIGEDGSLALDRVRPIEELESGYTYFADGDVAIAKITPCFENGKGAVMRGLHRGCGFGTTELIVLRPSPERLDSTYLYRILRSHAFMQRGEASMYGAGGQKRVPDDFVRNFATALPPVHEQVAINTFLDRETAKIDALVAEQEQLIALLKEKRQAVISHAVTKGLDPSVPMKDSGVEWLGEVPAHWSAVRLKFLASDIKAGPFGSALTKDMYASSGYRVYGQEQVIPGDFSLGDYYIDEATFAQLAQYATQEGDVLISCVGTFGKVAVVPESAEPGIINPRLIRLRVVDDVSPNYLAVVLRSTVTFEQFSVLSRGGTMDVINIGTLSDIWVAVPPYSEQQSILEDVQRLMREFDALVDEAALSVELLRERRSALVSAAVTGQIDVRGLAAAQQAA